jgi:hypothetical protein
MAGEATLLGTAVAPGVGTAIGAGVDLLGNIIGGVINANSAHEAAAAQMGYANKAMDAVNAGYGKAAAAQQPYQQAGQQGLAQLSQGVASNAYSTDPSQFQYQQYQATPFNAADITNDQGYQFRMQQGTDAVQNIAAARGTGLSGATLKALNRYGQGFASEELNQAYQRNLQTNTFGAGQNQLSNVFGYNAANNNYNQRNEQNMQRYGQQSSLANMGFQSANNLSSLYSGQANQQSGIYGQMGNAEAAGIMGEGNAYAGMFQNAGQAGSLATMAMNPYQGNGNNAISNTMGARNQGYPNYQFQVQPQYNDQIYSG